MRSFHSAAPEAVNVRLPTVYVLLSVQCNYSIEFVLTKLFYTQELLVDRLERVSRKYVLLINTEKTKIEARQQMGHHVTS